MKKSLGSFIAINRKSLLLLGVVLSLATFGIVTWRIDAQRIITKQDRNKIPGTETTNKTGFALAKWKMMMADDEQALNQSADVTPEPVSTEEPSGSAGGNPLIYA